MTHPNAVNLSAVLSFALLLSGVVAPSALALDAGAQSAIDPASTAIAQLEDTYAAEQAAFFASDYTYDDAVVLSEFWGQSLGEAKARIGRKINWGAEDVQVLNNYLADARAQAEQPAAGSTYEAEQNTFFASDYSYDDAAVLSEFWGQSLGDTKARIGRKINWGGENVQILNDYLSQAYVQANQDAFFASDYTYNDAVVLSEFWGESLGETKARIGSKLDMPSSVAYLNSELVEARFSASPLGRG